MFTGLPLERDQGGTVANNTLTPFPVEFTTQPIATASTQFCDCAIHVLSYHEIRVFGMQENPGIIWYIAAGI